MDVNFIKYLTSPAMVSYADVISDALTKAKKSASLMENALENDKYAIVGREAQKLVDLIAILEAAHKEIQVVDPLAKDPLSKK